MNKYLKAIFETSKYGLKSNIILVVGWIINETFPIVMGLITAGVISAIELGSTEKIYFWVKIFLVAFILKVVARLILPTIHHISRRIMQIGLLKKYLHNYIELDNTKVETFGTGRMNNIIFKGFDAVHNVIDESRVVIGQIVAIILGFVLIYIKVPNLWYFLFFILSFLFVIFFFVKGVGKTMQIRKDVKMYQVELDRKNIKILMSKFEIQQNNKLDSDLEKINDLITKETKLRTIGNLKREVWNLGGTFITNLYYLVVFLVVGVGVITGNYDIATFVLFIWIVQQLANYSWEIRKALKEITFYFVDVERLVDIFEEIPKYKDDSKLPNFQYKNGDINLEKINFAYNKDSQVFKDFSLRLEGGKRYAFVGQSGGGKTTLVKLLAQYIIPNSGKIIIDKQNLQEVNLKSYYKSIGYLSQEPNVFDGTVMENLVYALDREPTKEELEKVIKSSRSEFIYELPNGLETEIGERGVKLSGGQKQRLAIAKIMLKNPYIILLDEPTSALDSFNEEEITEALKNLFKGKTTIIIAHRLQTVKNADKIFFIENGKIIEEGNHRELLKLKGKYYNMIELQSGF